MEVDARTPIEEAPYPDVVDTLDRATGLMCAASAEALRAVAVMDEQKLWRANGATSTSEWLCARYRFTWGTSLEWVRVARRLRELPEISRAYANGRISWDQLRPLTKFAEPETDAMWAKQAPCRPPAELYREADRHAEVRREEVEEVRRLRSLTLTREPERHAYYLEATLPAEEGAAVEAALSKRAEKVVVTDDPLDRSGARMVDALVELVTGSAGTEPARAIMVVHADVNALEGKEPSKGPWLAETETGARLSPDAIRRLACDADVEVLLKSAGRPVGIGRRSRTVPGYILRALRHRDMGCRFPGCGRKMWVYAHHLVHWADGGPTDLENLVLLCHAHHRLIHEGGWRTSGHPAGDLRFHDPGGTPLRMTPPELRPEVRAQYFP